MIGLLRKQPYNSAEEAQAAILAKSEEISRLQHNNRVASIDSLVGDVDARFNRKIAKIDQKRDSQKIRALYKHGKSFDSEIESLAEDTEIEHEDEAVYQKSGSTFGQKLNRAGLTLLLIGAGIQGIGLADGVMPIEKYMPVKRVVIQEGQNLYTLANELDIPLEKITAKYEAAISDFDPRTDVHVGNQITAVGYGSDAIVGLDTKQY